MFSKLLNKKYNNLKVVKGNLFELAKNGDFDVIVQGNNCFNTQGAGIAVMFNRLFNTLDFPMEKTGRGDKNKLGNIDFRKFSLSSNGNWFHDEENGVLFVVNSYTQYDYKRTSNNDRPADYKAISEVFQKLNTQFKGLRIGLPAIGAGLAGGDINVITELMDENMLDCKVTLVLL